MNDNCCYTFVVRQITCQADITKNFDNIYTSIPIGTEIPLNFGYSFTFIACTTRSATIMISNPNFMPNTNFYIVNESFKIFDLPCECATFRVQISARLTPCESCCNS